MFSIRVCVMSRNQISITSFSCPFPVSKIFRINAGAAYLERGREARLVIDNVTYDYQGEYECRATNYINGQERTVPSEPVSLQVVGKQIVCHSPR